METKFKVKYGVRTFERIYDNLATATSALRDILSNPPEEHNDWKAFYDDRIRSGFGSRVMASASTNLIYNEELFNTDTQDRPISANKVIEFYVKFETIREEGCDFSGDTLLCSLTANIGGSGIEYFIGWDPTSTDVPEDIKEEEADLRNTMMDYFDWAFKKMIHDMDEFIDNEQKDLRRTCYNNMISKEINKSVLNAVTKNPEKYGWAYDNAKDKPLAEVICMNFDVTDESVTRYPIKSFEAEFNVSDGSPFCRYIVEVVGSVGMEDPDPEIRTYISLYNRSVNEYTEYMYLFDENAVLSGGSFTIPDPGLNAELIYDVLTPVVKEQIPHIAVLQAAIIKNTMEKLSSTPN